jgi:hypothetical protein
MSLHTLDLSGEDPFPQTLPFDPPTLTMLTTIPVEVQEAIVVQCAAIEPGSLASLAQTNSSLRRLICQPEDQHLWRTAYTWRYLTTPDTLSVFTMASHSKHKRLIGRLKLSVYSAQCSGFVKRNFLIKRIDYYFDEDASEAFLLVAHLARPCTSGVDMVTIQERSVAQ